MPNRARGGGRGFKICGGKLCADRLRPVGQNRAIADNNQRNAARTGKKIQAQFRPDSGRIAGSDDDGKIHCSVFAAAGPRRSAGYSSRVSFAASGASTASTASDAGASAVSRAPFSGKLRAVSTTASTFSGGVRRSTP